MRLPEWMTPDQVVVEPYAGDGARGPVYGPPVHTRGRYEQARQTVRGRDGRQVTATGLVILPLDAIDELPVESRISVQGITSTAVAVARWAYPGAPGHWEVRLR